MKLEHYIYTETVFIDSKEKKKPNISKCPVFVDVLCFLIVNYLTAYPAVYGQFPQAIPQPLAAVAPTQREGKNYCKSNGASL